MRITSNTRPSFRRKKHACAALLVLMVLGLTGCGAQAPTASASANAPAANSSTVSAAAPSPAASSSAEGFTQQERTLATQQALELTKQLVPYALDAEAVQNSGAVTDRMVTCFILSLGSQIENESNPYNTFVTKEQGIYIFPKDKVQRVAWELFGEESWGFADDIQYNNEKQQYESGLEFGIGGAYSCKDMLADIQPDSNTVRAVFTLTDSTGYAGEPGWKEYGQYTITYEMMRDENGLFLRYSGLQNAA